MDKIAIQDLVPGIYVMAWPWKAGDRVYQRWAIVGVDGVAPFLAVRWAVDPSGRTVTKDDLPLPVEGETSFYGPVRLPR